MKPSPIQKLWKYRWVILALGLHAAIFLLIAAGIFLRVWKYRAVSEGEAISPKTSVYCLILANMLALMALLLSNQIFSPQYLLWISPTIAVLSAIRREMRTIGWLFLLIALFTQLVFPFLYNFLIELHPVPVVFLFLRNLLLASILVYTIWRLPSLLYVRSISLQ